MKLNSSRGSTALNDLIFIKTSTRTMTNTYRNQAETVGEVFV